MLRPLPGSILNLVDAEKETRFDKDGAWRVGLSYLAPSGWDAGVKYLHFKTGGQSSVGEEGVDGSGVWANRLDRSLADDILNGDFDDGICDFARQELKLEFNIWDVELGHTVRTTQDTAFRFFGGLRHIDLDSDSKILYAEYGSNAGTAEIKERLDTKGWGGRIGGAFMWDIGDTGLSLNVGSALSLVYANFEAYRQEIQQTGTNLGYRRVTTDFYSLMPIMDIDLGLKYQYKSFFLQGGYLFSYWFNGDLKYQMGSADDVDGSTTQYDYEKANLSVNGWTLKAGVLF